MNIQVPHTLKNKRVSANLEDFPNNQNGQKVIIKMGSGTGCSGYPASCMSYRC